MYPYRGSRRLGHLRGSMKQVIKHAINRIGVESLEFELSSYNLLLLFKYLVSLTHSLSIFSPPRLTISGWLLIFASIRVSYVSTLFRPTITDYRRYARIHSRRQVGGRIGDLQSASRSTKCKSRCIVLCARMHDLLNNHAWAIHPPVWPHFLQRLLNIVVEASTGGR